MAASAFCCPAAARIDLVEAAAARIDLVEAAAARLGYLGLGFYYYFFFLLCS